MCANLIGHPFPKGWTCWLAALHVSLFQWAESTRHLATTEICLPATVEVVRKLRPKSFIIENVKGLTRSSFANYYQYILLQLEFPEVVRRNSETWMEHFERLQTEKTSGTLHLSGLTYNVVPTLVNAADYGIPQKRERVFIVGFRSDLGIEWSFPAATYSQDALLHSQWVTGEYWTGTALPNGNALPLPQRGGKNPQTDLQPVSVQ